MNLVRQMEKQGMRRISGGKTSSSVCLFVQCICYSAPCERIHTVSLLPIPGKSKRISHAFFKWWCGLQWLGSKTNWQHSMIFFFFFLTRHFPRHRWSCFFSFLLNVNYFPKETNKQWTPFAVVFTRSSFTLQLFTFKDCKLPTLFFGMQWKRHQPTMCNEISNEATSSWHC